MEEGGRLEVGEQEVSAALGDWQEESVTGGRRAGCRGEIRSGLAEFESCETFR